LRTQICLHSMRVNFFFPCLPTTPDVNMSLRKILLPSPATPVPCLCNLARSFNPLFSNTRRQWFIILKGFILRISKRSPLSSVYTSPLSGPPPLKSIRPSTRNLFILRLFFPPPNTGRVPFLPLKTTFNTYVGMANQQKPMGASNSRFFPPL